MKAKPIIFLVAVLLLLAPVAFSQSRDTGAIEGKATDQEGAALPGVNVTVTSASLMGTRTYVTDANGYYRFPALPPGTYTLKAELQGFKTFIQESIRVTTTVRLTVDLAMTQTAVEEEVTVVAQSPTVDVKSTETASVTLSNELLRNIPYSQFTSDIVNLAPGVNPDDVAYGASSGTGIAYSMDGVNVADPEAGTAWVFLDHNIVEEAKVMALGLPAEYGNFTGVIFNLVTKSGGNKFAGHFEFTYQGKQGDWPSGLWQTDNNQAYLDDFDLSSPQAALFDLNAHLGGPIIRDKLWFYIGTQYYVSRDWITGFTGGAWKREQPRLFTKLTSQLSSKTNMTFSLEVDTYVCENRNSHAWMAPESTLNQDSPEVVANFSLTHIISPKTFVDVKAAFFWGYYYLEPKIDRDPVTGIYPYGHWNNNTGNFSGASYYFYYADRNRFQVNASITHYAEDFIKGNHDFKFGVEAERSWVRSQYGYPGPNHLVYWDYWGPAAFYPGYYYTGNYARYQYQGYDVNNTYVRVEAFAQDSWQITPRLNLNLGVRFSQNFGWVKYVDGTVIQTTRLAPRLGFTYDIFGNKTTILKGHYGQFTDAMLSALFDRLNPPSAYYDYVTEYWNPVDNYWYEYDREVHYQVRKADEGINHPYMDQFTVSLERELFKDASFTVTGIYRKWNNIVALYDTAAQFAQRTITVPFINKDIVVWARTTPGTVHDFVLANIKKGDPGILLDPYRKYWGLELLFNKRFSNRWQMLASYVYSHATGTVDNGQADDMAWGGIAGDPNFWVNADGTSTYDNTHMLKVQGTYVLPFDINFNVYYHALTGNAWTSRYRYRLPQGRTTIFTEKRGSNHYPISHLLDIRLEKIFPIAERYRLGIIVDVFNLLNDDTIYSWGTRLDYDWFPGDWPSTEGHDLYGIQTPRRARLGIRLIF